VVGYRAESDSLIRAGRKIEMRVNESLGCNTFPCVDVRHECYLIPNIDLNPDDVAIILISEAAPENSKDYYYAEGDPLFQKTTVQAFKDAGVNVSSIRDLLERGVYLTTAVKCGKERYTIKANTIKECSLILEKELDLFPKVEVFMLMGDVAIRAVNYISKRAGDGLVIPAGSTYKIRGKEYFFRGKRAFPSYLQAGPSFVIEKSKRRMITEDITEAFKIIQ
jgi:hypothetical protein